MSEREAENQLWEKVPTLAEKLLISLPRDRVDKISAGQMSPDGTTNTTSIVTKVKRKFKQG